MTRCDIVVAGHICVDITPKFLPTPARTIGELLVPGKLLEVGACVVSTGGPVSNTGVALSRIGAKVDLMARVGEDTFGSIVVEKMREAGCGDGIRRIKGEVTAYTIVIAPPGIDRVFLHDPGANDTFTADDVAYERLDGARLFHYGYPPLMKKTCANNGEELVRMYKQAKEHGVTTSLDMALPDPDSPTGRIDWRALLENVLPYVDIFLPSVEEVLFFLERDRFLEKRNEARRRGIESLDLVTPDEYSRLGAEVMKLGAGIVALKSGHRGIYMRTAGADRLERFGRAAAPDAANWAGRELWSAAYHVDQVANATGSGDCAIAGFLASYLRGETIEQALDFATAAGRQNVLVYDATSGILPWAETAAAMKSWRKKKLDITAAGWRFDDCGQLWHGPADAR